MECEHGVWTASMECGQMEGTGLTLHQGVGLGGHGETSVERVYLPNVQQSLLQQPAQNVQRLRPHVLPLPARNTVLAVGLLVLLPHLHSQGMGE